MHLSSKLPNEEPSGWSVGSRHGRPSWFCCGIEQSRRTFFCLLIIPLLGLDSIRCSAAHHQRLPFGACPFKVLSQVRWRFPVSFRSHGNNRIIYQDDHVAITAEIKKLWNWRVRNVIHSRGNG
ncbi:hypothetical protein BDW67DRAFT_160757 [Aspergillus spinulosporus]